MIAEYRTSYGIALVGEYETCADILASIPSYNVSTVHLLRGACTGGYVHLVDMIYNLNGNILDIESVGIIFRLRHIDIIEHLHRSGKLTYDQKEYFFEQASRYGCVEVIAILIQDIRKNILPFCARKAQTYKNLAVVQKIEEYIAK